MALVASSKPLISAVKKKLPIGGVQAATQPTSGIIKPTKPFPRNTQLPASAPGVPKQTPMSAGAAILPTVPKGSSLQPAPKPAAPKPAAPTQLQPGTPVPGMEGVDLSKPGAEEQFYSDNQNYYTDPSNTQTLFETDPFADPYQGSQWFDQNGGQFSDPFAGETYWNQVGSTLQGPTSTTNWVEGNQSALRGPGEGEEFVGDTLTKYKGGTPGTSNRAEEAFQQFQETRPGIDFDAGLDPYYENAKERGAEELNRQLAARGVFGSGRGVDKLSDMFTGLEAEQANRESDFKLRQLAEGRQWDSLMGDLAGSADMSSRLGAQNELAWTQGLGNLALGAQGLGIDRFRAGTTASAAADASQIQQALAAGQISAEAAREMLMRLQTQGDFAFNAGQEDFGRDTANADLAASADTTTLNKRIAGQNAASGAQTAQRYRAGDWFDRIFGMGQELSDVTGNAFNGLFDADKQNLDDKLAALGGKFEKDAADKQQAADKAAADKARKEALDAARENNWLDAGARIVGGLF